MTTLPLRNPTGPAPLRRSSVPAPNSAAARLAPVLEAVLGADLPVTVRCWDGSEIPATAPAAGRGEAAIEIRSPLALRRILWAPGELGLGRAYVTGDLDYSGDIYDLLALRDRFGHENGRREFRPGLREWTVAAKAAIALGALGPPPPVPPEEVRLHGRRHSMHRDAASISHHYDVSNDFYRLFLGETMTYSCGYFPTPDTSLDDAQRGKYELVCRKLGLRPGMRLLDVGCGWGGMAMHAAEHHGVRAVGVTLSQRQADRGRERVAAAGLDDRVEIRVQDYREIDDGPYDAISSIGMFEHVGLARLAEYFSDLYALLPPGGRLLNHAISTPYPDGKFGRRSFIHRYVFPDGELHEVGRVVSAMHAQRFEVRDVESLREHYARTLRHWVARLELHWDEAVELVGLPRARIWKLYMAASALSFEAGAIGIHQTLAVRRAENGASHMPATRDGFSLRATESAAADAAGSSAR